MYPGSLHHKKIVIVVAIYCYFGDIYFAGVELTYWDRDKLAAIFQSTFSKGFSSSQMCKFRLRFHWCSFPRCQITVFQHALVQLMSLCRPPLRPSASVSLKNSHIKRKTLASCLPQNCYVLLLPLVHKLADKTFWPTYHLAVNSSMQPFPVKELHGGLPSCWSS